MEIDTSKYEENHGNKPDPRLIARFYFILSGENGNIEASWYGYYQHVARKIVGSSRRSGFNKVELIRHEMISENIK